MLSMLGSGRLARICLSLEIKILSHKRKRLHGAFPHTAQRPSAMPRAPIGDE